MGSAADTAADTRARSPPARTGRTKDAAAIIACDFCVVVTATFRLFYVLVVIEHASRRIIHLDATTHPTAAWTLQQLREVILCVANC